MSKESFKLFYSKSRTAVLIKRDTRRIRELPFRWVNSGQRFELVTVNYDWFCHPACSSRHHQTSKIRFSILKHVKLHDANQPCTTCRENKAKAQRPSHVGHAHTTQLDPCELSL